MLIKESMGCLVKGRMVLGVKEAWSRKLEFLVKNETNLNGHTQKADYLSIQLVLD